MCVGVAILKKELPRIFKWRVFMNKKQTVFKTIRYVATILFGCIVYSLGVSLFLDANKLASGGLTGVALVLNNILSNNGITIFDVGTLNIILNIPMFILGFIYFGKRFFLNTACCVAACSALISFWTWLFGDCLNLLPLTQSPLVAAVFGGALFGFGAGIIFKMGGSTGGTDIPVKILRTKFRHIKTGVISMIADIVIVACSFFIDYDFETVLYTVISVIIFTPVFDWVLYGGNSAKTVYIITDIDKCDLIKSRILKELDIGATLINAEGAYTGDAKRILLCVVKPFLYPKLRDIVRDEDNKAFMIVSSAKEIYGEGYQNPSDEDL